MNNVINLVDEINKRLISLAKAEDWLELVSVSERRHKIIERYFSQSDTKKTRESVTELLDKVRQTDSEITAIIEKKKQEYTSNSFNLKSGLKAAQKYQNNFDKL